MKTSVVTFQGNNLGEHIPQVFNSSPLNALPRELLNGSNLMGFSVRFFFFALDITLALFYNPIIIKRGHPLWMASLRGGQKGRQLPQKQHLLGQEEVACFQTVEVDPAGNLVASFVSAIPDSLIGARPSLLVHQCPHLSPQNVVNL